MSETIVSSQTDVVIAKVLVIDDTEANLQSISALLQAIGVQVVCAQSAEQGINIAQTERISLILVNIVMPDINGYEIVTRLSLNPASTDIPFIFMGAFNSDDQCLMGYAKGAIDLISKPINPDVLAAKVKLFLNTWALKQEMRLEIERRLAAEQEIHYLAQHDTLTKLPNRRYMLGQIDTLLERSIRQSKRFAILFLDLDGFKKINDELGHQAGDVFLKAVSERFKANIRSFDLIARYGGDEFIIVLSDVSESLDLTPKLNHLIDLALKPVDYRGSEIVAGVSIGVSIYPEHGSTTLDLINRADAAMYIAKRAGKNTFRFYSDNLNQALDRKLVLEKAIKQAIRNGEFEVLYQPLVGADSETIIGAEALLRWSNTELGEIRPMEFIPIAESSGVIHELGIWVLQETLPLMQRYPHMKFSINVSALQFNNQKLLDAFMELIDSTSILPGQLVVEITENVLIQHKESVMERLESMRNLGIELSIDDFGTGYSELSNLQLHQFEQLKIDRSFIASMKDGGDSTLVKGIIAMARALNINVVAEGVETSAQMEFLQQQECDAMQGFFISRPLNFEGFVELAEHRQKSDQLADK